MKYDIDHNDITVVNSSIELLPDKHLKYLLFEMEVKDSNDEIITIYKAIKLLRIKRLPKNIKQELKFMDVQSEVLGGLWERGVNFVSIIANILYPTPVGLLNCYGVQGISKDPDEAKRIADNDYAAISAALQGAYRTMEFDDLIYEEMDWLRDKISNMKCLSMVRGLPYPRKSSADSEATGVGGKDNTAGSQETTEELVAGLADKEYVIMMISSPVSTDTLRSWLTICAKENTRWQSQMQGTSGMTAGISLPMMFMGNVGASQGWNHGYSNASNIGGSHTNSSGITMGESFGQNSSVSHGTNANMGHSANIGHSTSQNQSTSDGQSYGINHSYSSNQGVSHSHTTGQNMSVSNGTNVSQSHSKGMNESYSSTQSHSSGQTVSNGKSTGGSIAVGSSQNTTQSQSQTNGHSTDHGSSDTTNAGFSVEGNAVFAKATLSGGYSHGESSGSGDTTSNSHSATNSQGSSLNIGQTAGETHGTSNSSTNSYSAGHSAGVNESWGTSVGQSHTVSQGASISDGESVSTSTGQSNGTSQSASLTNSVGQGASDSASSGISASNGQSDSVSNGTSHTTSNSQSQSQSDGNSWGTSQGVTNGESGAINAGMSTSMGIGPSLSINKSYQFVDVEVKNIVEMYDFQNERLMKALSGQGAFFVDMYISTPDSETKSSATELAKSAWGNNDALVCPLQVIDLEGEEKDHLFYHFASFSACNAKERVGDIMGYKYSTVLLPDELTAYTHPIRMSEGGQYADLENIPVFAVPSRMKGEIHLGTILSGERWTKTDGYRTKFEYRIDGSTALHHCYFCGKSRSGKTVAATRFVVEMALKTRRQGKKLRIIIMDPKQDWRVLAKFIELDRFKFYSLGDPEFLPIRFNLLKIPKGVRPQVYADGVIECFCRSYQLGEKVKPILRDAIYSAYSDAGVFERDWKQNASEKSRDVTFPLIYQRVKQKCEDLRSGKGTFNIVEAYERLLDRLDMFAKDYTTEYQLFGQGGNIGISIDEILGEDDVTVLESYGLDSTFKSFVFGLITAAIFQFATSHPGGFKAPDQYSTLLVIEEANEVLIGQGGDGQQSPVQGTSMFEKIVDQAAGLELFICAITQKIADMPQSIIANAGLAFCLKISREEDKKVIMNELGKDERIDDKIILKFFPKMPTGWCICKSGRSFEYKEQEPVLIQVDQLKVEPPTNDELEAIVKMAEVYNLRYNSKCK